MIGQYLPQTNENMLQCATGVRNVEEAKFQPTKQGADSVFKSLCSSCRVITTVVHNKVDGDIVVVIHRVNISPSLFQLINFIINWIRAALLVLLHCILLCLLYIVHIYRTMVSFNITK
jgi:hypothetical protein